MSLNKSIKTVQTVDLSSDLQSVGAALVADTSTTIATILGTAIATTARGCVIRVTGTGDVHYNPVGAATTSNAIIPTEFTVFGNKTRLDNIQFIGSSGTTPKINIIVFGDAV